MGMKIGVLSDTHLHKVTREFRKIYNEYLSDKDLILHAGDLVCPEVIDFLGKRNFHGVHGNMDPAEVKERLSRKEVIELGSYKIGLIHGGGTSDGLEDRIWPEFAGVDVIIYGHSHSPANHMREGVLLFNPGTASGFTFSGLHTIGILELDETIRGEIITL
jgi:putative phosphoesterase